MLSLIILAVTLGASHSCVTVHSIKGHVGIIPDDSTCTFLLNGYPVSKGTLKATRVYGLIQASCEDCATSHISRFEGCDDCIICEHNEGLQSCRSNWVPICVSAFAGFILCFSLLLSLWLADKKFGLLNKMIGTLHSFKIKRSEMKESKHEMRIRKVLEQRMRTSEEAIEAGQLEGGSVTERLYPALPVTPERKKSVGGSVAPALLLALGISSLQGSHACDDVLFLSSNGGLFMDKAFTTISTGLAYMHTGYTLCFKHESGGQEELTLSHLTVAETYGASYKTCDFSVDFKSHSRCLGTGYCWNSNECKRGVSLEAVGPKSYQLPESQKGCRLVPNMDDPCSYRQKCVWYYWDLVPNHQKCDLIYHLLGSTKIAHLSHKSQEGNVIPFTLTLDSPFTSHPLPIHLGPITTDYYPTFPSIRKHGGIALGVHAANKNEGKPGLLGDFQVPLLESQGGANWSYPLSSVLCQPDGRSMICQSAPPAYDSSLESDSHNVVDGNFEEMNSIFRRTKRVRGVVSLMFRSDPIVSQVVERASCGVKIISTYGCSSCDEMPRVFIKPHSISQTGFIRFTSNCSFYLPELSCSDQDQMLQLTHRPEACSLTFPDTNQTITAVIDYEFLGQIYAKGIMTYKPIESFSDKMSLAVQSPDFLSSLQISIGIGIATTLLVTIFKASVRYAALRSGMKETREVLA